jgi:excisionase family DNA binding protein
MAVVIEGQRYFSKSEVAEMVGISRPTLYRWIDEGKVPHPGYERKRDRRFFYSEAEAKAVQEFAHQMDRVESDSRDQLPLFEQRKLKPGDK